MEPFSLARPRTVPEALALLSATARPKGGGIDLLDLAKGGHPSPAMLVDVRRLQPGLPPLGVAVSSAGPGEVTVRVNSFATLADLAASADLGKRAPALAEAAAAAATPAIRNVATLAGNLLQRPRCVYFRDLFFDCRKRGGATCPAMEGEHSEGAVFGNGKCCAVHPSNLAVALLALDATVVILRDSGKPDEVEVASRRAAEFFVPPEEDPLREARLGPKDLVESVVFTPRPVSAYVEIDQKQSFDWASASAAVALVLEDGKVASARVALGHVAPVPLLSEGAAQALAGRAPDEAAAAAAADAAVKGATPLRDNAHKVAHLRACVRRAVLAAAARGR